MTSKAQHLADTIMRDLKRLLFTEMSFGQPETDVAELLKQNVGAVTCFSDLHDYMDANTLGESEKIWEELTADIPPEGDEKKVQAACDVLNEAQTIVDEWIKRGGLTADYRIREEHEWPNPDLPSVTSGARQMNDASKIARLFRTPAEELVKIDPSAWRETFSDIHAEDLRLLSNSLINLAVLAARMSAYIDARGGEGGKDKGHAEGVREQNQRAEKVREALGFQHPRADMNLD